MTSFRASGVSCQYHFTLQFLQIPDDCIKITSNGHRMLSICSHCSGSIYYAPFMHVSSALVLENLLLGQCKQCKQKEKLAEKLVEIIVSLKLGQCKRSLSKVSCSYIKRMRAMVLSSLTSLSLHIAAPFLHIRFPIPIYPSFLRQSLHRSLSFFVPLSFTLAVSLVVPFPWVSKP